MNEFDKINYMIKLQRKASVTKAIIRLISLIVMITGIIITKGFWSVFFVIVFPPYAYYVVIEHFLKLYGLI